VFGKISDVFTILKYPDNEEGNLFYLFEDVDNFIQLTEERLVAIQIEF